MSLRSISVGLRTALSFGFFFVVLLGVGLYSISQLANMQDNADSLENNWLASITALGSISDDIATVRVNTLRIVTSKEPKEREGFRQRIADARNQLATDLDHYTELVSSEQEKALLKQFLNARAVYVENQAQVTDAAMADRAQNEEDIDAMNQAASTMAQSLMELKKVNLQGAADAAEDARNDYRSSRNSLVTILVIMALISVVISVLTIRSIKAPLAKALNVAQRIAKGELNVAINPEGKDELTELLTALSNMQQSLRRIVEKIQHASAALATDARQINEAARSNSATIEHQNNQIHLAATAVNELTAAIEDVANNATSTSEASQKSARSVESGLSVVSSTKDAIEALSIGITNTSGQINQLSDNALRISSVLDVIRAVSEQTNLLALNAAIEAARAGDQGRGFAVVADEVRSLAQRTQQSAQEIESMIVDVQTGANSAVSAMENSLNSTRSSVEASEKANQALADIMDSVNYITERNLLIASASEEQSQVAKEVDMNLTRINDLAQESAVAFQQASRSSEQLLGIAQSLEKEVSVFRL
ncbi:methyl-accepting chemotaxis protein [Pokkaliibacter sp. CJK22405]|uniref:methyl-accepting chemotaxis protein n=1 Tax=Pokkaliibacter sp. CJK22405 TaxID=3384615 RepID=UPI003984CF99